MGALEGKWVLVTGGNSGLGKETALHLAELGASVVLTARNTEAGNQAAEQIKQKCPRSLIVVEKLDLASDASVKAFAERYKNSKRPLHVFVANAGANFTTNRLTSSGVPLQNQVNYLGHYHLARLLEPILIASAPSRIVNVSSVTHRYSSLTNVLDFLTKPAHSRYGHTKLAQLLFSAEAQRRLGPLGVDIGHPNKPQVLKQSNWIKRRNLLQSSAVDPGGVKTNVWKGIFGKPPIIWYINTFLSPSWDGAKAIVHAATADTNKEKLPKKLAARGNDLRFYAKGLFASPAVTWYGGPSKGLLGKAQNAAFFVGLFFVTLLDWPARYFSSGRILAEPKRCEAMRQAYDLNLAKDLWEQSADLTGMPKEPQLSSNRKKSPVRRKS